MFKTTLKKAQFCDFISLEACTWVSYLDNTWQLNFWPFITYFNTFNFYKTKIIIFTVIQWLEARM